MNVNTRALDAALNVMGLTMGLPVNAFVFHIHNALVAAEQTGFQQGYEAGHAAGMSDEEERQEFVSEDEYIRGYAQGAADMQAEDAAEIESLEREVKTVAKEQYDDGYLDASHDYKLAPELAQQTADFIEEQRELKAVALAMDPKLVTVFPVDAEELQ